jgi:hypothetical protein
VTTTKRRIRLHAANPHGDPTRPCGLYPQAEHSICSSSRRWVNVIVRYWDDRAPHRRTTYQKQEILATILGSLVGLYATPKPLPTPAHSSEKDAGPRGNVRLTEHFKKTRRKGVWGSESPRLGLNELRRGGRRLTASGVSHVAVISIALDLYPADVVPGLATSGAPV